MYVKRITRVLLLLVIIAPLVTHARNDDFEETIVSVLTQGLFYNYHQVQMNRSGSNKDFLKVF